MAMQRKIGGQWNLDADSDGQSVALLRGCMIFPGLSKESHLISCVSVTVPFVQTASIWIRTGLSHRAAMWNLALYFDMRNLAVAILGVSVPTQNGSHSWTPLFIQNLIKMRQMQSYVNIFKRKQAIDFKHKRTNATSIKKLWCCLSENANHQAVIESTI